MVYDVVIVGAGLAGLTLARQLVLRDPSLKIALISKNEFPNVHIQHTVGESTVEIGAFYLREVLKLKNHMQQEHLPKMGLRFLQTDKQDYREYGIECFPYHDAYQIDRGKLENFLYENIKKDVDFYNERFIDFDIKDNNIKKIYTCTLDGRKNTYHAKWLIDASGRQRHFIKKFKATVASPLTHTAAWFRLDTLVDVNNFLTDDNSDNIFYNVERHYSTVHIMGAGYWVWIIPLPGGCTSIGIVFDENFYDVQEISRLDVALKWLSQHEPTLYEELKKYREHILDFKYLRRYSYNSDIFLSEKKLAVTGEAKGFVDPLYSNGTDFIAFENTMISETILCDKRSDSIEPYCRLYNQFISFMFECFQTCHVRGYEHFDKWHYITAKVDVDSIFYFGTFCVVFMNNMLGDVLFLEKAYEEVKLSYYIYKSIINFIKSDNFIKNSYEKKRYISILGSIQEEVNYSIICSSKEDILFVLQENRKILDFILTSLEGEKNYATIAKFPSKLSSIFQRRRSCEWLPTLENI